MLYGSFAFALMSLLTHALKERCDWQVTAFARTVQAFVIVAVWMALAGVRPVLFRPRILWLRSLAGSMSLMCNFYALPRLPVADVLTLTNLFPIWVALLSWPLERKAPSIGVWVSVVAGLTGVVLIQPPSFTGETLAALVALAASFFTAVAMMGLHRLDGVDPRAVVVHFSAVSLIFCTASLLVLPHNASLPTVWEADTLWKLVGVGVAATIGQLFLTKAFSAGPPAKVALIGLSQVAFAMVAEFVLWRQSYSPTNLAGMALVMAPTAWLMVNRME
jgi:drug/metabolite transporter (DMT)-like permease